MFQSRAAKLPITQPLTLIKPATFYSYRVSNNGKYSPWYNFHTYKLRPPIMITLHLCRRRARYYKRKANPKPEKRSITGTSQNRILCLRWPDSNVPWISPENISLVLISISHILNVTGIQYLKYHGTSFPIGIPPTFKTPWWRQSKYTLRYNDLQLFFARQ